MGICLWWPEALSPKQWIYSNLSRGAYKVYLSYWFGQSDSSGKRSQPWCRCKLYGESNRLAYHLYNLTYDEIKLIDPETPITKDEFND